MSSDEWPRSGPLDEHASPLRSLIGEATESSYTSYASLADASRDAQGTVILEGDDGGQIYVVVPARMVACSQARLEQLLRDLDAIAWACNDGWGAHLVFEQLAPGSPVAGGMGGGRLTAGVWVHPTLVELGIAAEIAAVLAGTAARLPRRARARRL